MGGTQQLGGTRVWVMLCISVLDVWKIDVFAFHSEHAIQDYEELQLQGLGGYTVIVMSKVRKNNN